MSDAPPPSWMCVTQLRAGALDDVCDRFEDAWTVGGRPQVEDYMKAVPEPEQPGALQELLLLDVHYRRQAGEAPRTADYADRFAGLDPVWLARAVGAPALKSTVIESPVPQQEAVSVPTVDRVIVPGYEILEELGRGAMGVVYKARQVRLDRFVALKMILAGAHAGPHELARFRTEAEAVARLQHPSIVQIHDVGEQDGRPFFAMEYVAGPTLARNLAGTLLPPSQAAELVERLARAMHYAHERGIVHRDLKPANILLTQDGTPKVSDFGLAKRLDLQAGDTQSGAIVGTPSYMAPEQAEGRVKDIGPLADVYALGAILYETLTGRPPFRAASALETLDQVRSREPVAPRLLQPRTPRDLETVCLKCLHKDPRRRYASAETLADDLGRFRAGQAVVARPVGLVERAVKWARRRPAVAALTAALVLAAAGLVGGGIWFTLQLRVERNRAQAQEAIAQQQRDATANAFFRLARLTAERASKTEAIAVFQQTLTVLETLARDNPHNSAYQNNLASCHVNLGGLYVALGRWDDAEAAWKAALAIREPLVQAEPIPQFRHDLASSHVNLTDLYRRLGRLKEAEAAGRRAIAILQPLTEEDPAADPFQSLLAAAHHNLGLVYQEDRLDRAEAELEAAHAIRDKLARDHPDMGEYKNALAGSYNDLALLYLRQNKLDKTLDADRKAIELRRELVRADSNVTRFRNDLAGSYLNLGEKYRLMGKYREAEEAYQEALTLWTRLAREDPLVSEYEARLAACHHDWGLLNLARGNLSVAQEENLHALRLRERLHQDQPQMPAYQSELAATLYNLGEVYRLQENLPEAEQAYERARALQEKLVGQTTPVEYLNNLLGSCYNLAELHRKAKRFEQAYAACRQGIATSERLVGLAPADPRYQSNLASWHHSLGMLCYERGQLEQAAAAYRKAITLREKLVDPPADMLIYLSGSYNNLAEVYQAAKKPDLALPAYKRAITLLTGLPPESRNAVQVQTNLAIGHTNLGKFYAAANSPGLAEVSLSDALAILEKSIDANPALKPELRDDYVTRAEVRTQLSRYPDALQDWDKALANDDGSLQSGLQARRAATRACAGDHARAMEAVTTLSGNAALPGEVVYNLACAASLCVTAARQDARLTPADRDRLAEEYAVRAVGLLVRTQTTGFFKVAATVDQLKRDEELNPLRSREDFKKLLAGLGG